MKMSMKKALRSSKARYVTSKMGKTKAIEVNEALRKHVPVTKRMTAATLQTMLEQYKMVYVKPNVGMFGNGVIRVEQVEDEEERSFTYQAGTRLNKFKTFSAMYASLHQLTSKRPYLVQKGIHLLTYRGNRFDLRVMVQMTPRHKWETTGIIGRVAHPAKIVTNYHNGGKLKSLDTLLQKYLSAVERKVYVKQLQGLGIKVAKAINARYKGVKEVGVDVALDQELVPWILEVNTSPDPYIFRVLKDKRIYAKIRRYGKAYGRL